MTRQQAVDYIKEQAGPYGLTWECMQCFEADEASTINRGKEPNYGELAWAALYEWDI